MMITPSLALWIGQPKQKSADVQLHINLAAKPKEFTMKVRILPRHRLAGCLGAIMLGVSAGEPAAADRLPDWSNSLARNRPWQALEAIGQAPENRQIAAQISVFLGQEQPACALRVPGVPRAVAGVEYRDALEVIVHRARDSRVVMLNESHFRRAHRMFLGQLLEALHTLGFDALAAETFAHDVSATLEDGVPDAATGFYTADPAFAATLRRAHTLGWAFVPYESKATSAREAREIGQAEALAEWLEANPGRRLLVYAGGSHISKNPEEGWMAARFAARTGIDPLTVAQGATACPDADDEWPVDTQSPVVAVRGEKPMASNHVDIIVLHPPAAVVAAEEARGALVSLCVAPHVDATLLRAFAAGDDDNAIAWDQAVVPAGAADVQLRLVPGRYRIAREDTRELETLGHVAVQADPVDGCLQIGSR